MKYRLLAIATDIEKLQRLLELESKNYEADRRLDGITRIATRLDHAADLLGRAREHIALFTLEAIT